MKVKIKISYEWEKDLTEGMKEALEEWSEASIEEYKNEYIKFNHAINCLDTAADNHIMCDYNRKLDTTWIE